MRPEERIALKDAVEKKRKKEAFEDSLARQVKNQDLSYDDYIRLITDIRDLAKKEKKPLEEAALALAAQE